MSEIRQGYQAESDTNDLPNCPINESGESNKITYKRTEGEYEDLERQLDEAKKSNFLQKKRFQRWIKWHIERCGSIGRTDLIEMYDKLKEKG